jgi:hypothetical protein
MGFTDSIYQVSLDWHGRLIDLNCMYQISIKAVQSPDNL